LNFRDISVPNKTLNIPNEKTFPNGMCPINVKNVNRKEITDKEH
jgi:hypothetical protein